MLQKIGGTGVPKKWCMGGFVFDNNKIHLMKLNVKVSSATGQLVKRHQIADNTFHAQ